jgi:predicted short-subunit dehydrogenase-like oxidoreductase (DUF2520 family)
LLTKKTEIVFIGAGKVAHTLVPLLIKKNYSVKGIISKSTASASSLAKKYKVEYYSSDFKKIPLRSGIFFITVPDNQILNAARNLASLKLKFDESLFVHTSGSESSLALKAIQKKGGMTASFHIMQTFPSIAQTEIKNSFAAIESKSAAAEIFLFSLARTLNLKSFKLDDTGKVFYHLAGVFAANFLNANFYSSEKLLNKLSISGRDHYYMFEPIVKATLSNIKNNGVSESLSGPVQRGDFCTVQKHIAVLKKHKQGKKRLLLHSYISQSLILVEIIKRERKQLTRDQNKLKKILEAELKNF